MTIRILLIIYTVLFGEIFNVNVNNPFTFIFLNIKLDDIGMYHTYVCVIIECICDILLNVKLIRNGYSRQRLRKLANNFSQKFKLWNFTFRL